MRVFRAPHGGVDAVSGGMAWRTFYEMSAAMVLPVIPFLCLVWLSITRSAQCGRAAS